MPKPIYPFQTNLQLRISLSLNSCLLCSLTNKGDKVCTFFHSPFSMHTQLLIFTENGESMPYKNRLQDHLHWYDTKDEMHEIVISPGKTVHISHAKVISYQEAEKRLWKVTWGVQSFEDLPQGVYRLVLYHPQTFPSNMVTFMLPPSEEELEKLMR